MLKKLIKYDMKALSRTLLLLHAVALVFAIIGRLFITSNILMREPNFFEALYMLTFFLILGGIYFATFALFGIHFYKSLFSTQGYLSWTLPVTAHQHLLSKLLVAFLWNILSFCALLLAISIFFFNPNVGIIKGIDEFFAYFGNNAIMLIFITLLFLLLSTLSSILTLYSSAAIGQLFTNHRVLASIVTYAIFAIVAQIAYTLALFTLSYHTYETSMEVTIVEVAGIDTAAATIAPYLRIVSISSVMAIVQIVALYGLTYYLTKRKLNLA